MVIRELRRRLVLALVAFSECMPAMLIGVVCLRVAELKTAFVVNGGGVGQFAPSFGSDLLALIRYSPLLFLLSLPLLWIEDRRLQTIRVGVFFTVVLVLHALLVSYYFSAGVPLGADLFAYSLDEIRTTVAGQGGMRPQMMAGLAGGIALMWVGLGLRIKDVAWPAFDPKIAVAAMVACVACLVLLRGQEGAGAKGGTASTLTVSKMAFFIDDTARHAWRSLRAGASAGAGTSNAYLGKDADHPLLRPEATPDTLGEHFNAFGTRPNVVIILVEGLGRSFSGPHARLGSFTPFLDELAARSLYWENFVATQGRTFGALGSILASVPYGRTGFNELKPYPQHHSLVSLMKSAGYDSAFFTGSNLEFDSQGDFLKAEGVAHLFKDADFGPQYKRSNDWGYADADLVDLTLGQLRSRPAQPGLTLVQTNSMHTPYVFNGMDKYRAMVDTHLDKLGIQGEGRAPHRAQRDIFASILYTDDALRAFFAGAAKLPGYNDTIFVVTGDHRLPEVPMETRIERYHVPLIVFSPRLKAPRAIKAVSSHFDIAPSLLAFLSANHGLETPPEVTWLGTGLDTEAGFRNLHAFPIKQTKTELSDFVSGTVYLGQDKLYALADGMQIEPLEDAAMLARAREQFNAFKAANERMVSGGRLLPAAPAAAPVAYNASKRTLQVMATAAQHGRLSAGDTTVQLKDDKFIVETRFSNAAATVSPAFVPLAVLTRPNGEQIAEGYGKAMTLEPGKDTVVRLELPAQYLVTGQYYVAVIPSHPDTGKSLGAGQYHVGIRR